MRAPPSTAVFALVLGTALLAFRYAHEVLKLALAGQHVDLAAYYLYTRGALAGIDVFAPGAVTTLASAIQSPYTISLPTFLPGGYVLMIPIALLPYRVAGVLWVLAGQAFVLLACVAWGRAVGLRGPLAAAAAMLVLSFQPTLENVATGQLSLLVLALVALGVRAQVAGRPLPAALFLSLGLQLKPHYVLLVVFLAWIGAPVTALLTFAGVGLWSGLAVLLFGPAWLVAYWTAMRDMLARSPHLHVWLMNLSPHAMLHRFAGDAGPRLATDALAIALACALAVLVLRVVRPPLEAPREGVLAAWAVALAAVPLASPLTEEHHLALLLLPLLWALARVEDLSGAWRACLVGACVLLAARYSVEAFAVFDRGVASLAHGGKAAGTALLLAVACHLASRTRAAGAAGVPARA